MVSRVPAAGRDNPLTRNGGNQTVKDPMTFGTWTVAHGAGDTDVTADVNTNVTGHVVAVNEQQRWEEELSSFVLDVADSGNTTIR